jgi:omega-6 fatty acid desaturase (delta-12 desaturase)
VAMLILVTRGASWILILPLQAAAALLAVRIFVLFHDCAHNSLFLGRRANRVAGFLSGILVFNSYAVYRASHGAHHSVSGNLDRRGYGDIWTLTTREYRGSPPWKRLAYRVFRHPLFLFGVAPVFIFALARRFPRRAGSAREIPGLMATNAGVAGLAALIMAAAGWKAWLQVQIPILALAGCLGVWLFYTQHQFDPSYWEHSTSWSFTDAALLGSSYFRLPRLVQVFLGHVGLHHIHHLRPRIPSYNLGACLAAFPELDLANPLTFRRSLRALRLSLWDEELRSLTGFREARAHRLDGGRTDTA